MLIFLALFCYLRKSGKNTERTPTPLSHFFFTFAKILQIADFGTSLWTQHTTRLATYTTKPRETVGLSLPWAAPEVRQSNLISEYSR